MVDNQSTPHHQPNILLGLFDVPCHTTPTHPCQSRETFLPPFLRPSGRATEYVAVAQRPVAAVKEKGRRKKNDLTF